MHIQVINLDEMPVHMMTCHVLVCLTPECYICHKSRCDEKFKKNLQIFLKLNTA